MRLCSWIKQTRREYIRNKRRALRRIKKDFRELKLGATVQKIYGTKEYLASVLAMQTAIERVELALKDIKC